MNGRTFSLNPRKRGKSQHHVPTIFSTWAFLHSDSFIIVSSPIVDVMLNLIVSTWAFLHSDSFTIVSSPIVDVMLKLIVSTWAFLHS